MQELQFETDGRKARWWGYGDFYCVSPAGTRILLPYQSEPPHGDSYHRLLIGSKTIRGYVWSGYLRWSPCGRYFTCDWLEDLGGHRSEEHTSELQSRENLVCRLLLEKKKNKTKKRNKRDHNAPV